MTALETRKQVQSLLGCLPDGQFGPRTRQAFDALSSAPEDSPWPMAPAPPPQPASGAMSQRFLDFIPFIFDHEGRSFENDPNDDGNNGDGSPGNYGTKFGVDARSHPKTDIVHLTEAQATAIYWQEWLKEGCEAMSSPRAEVFFDTAVNQGLGKAKQYLSNYAPADAKKFLDLRDAFYRQLGSSPKYAPYLKGWLNRTADLRKRFNLS